MKKLYIFLAILLLIPQTAFSQSSNYSLSFNGNSDYVSLPEGILNNPETFTIEAWIKPKVSNTNVVPFYCQGATGFIFFEMDGNLRYFKLQLQLDDGTQNGQWFAAVSNVGISENLWHHVAAEYNKAAGRISVYLDGKLVGQNSIPTQYYPKSLGPGFPSRIGKSPDPTSLSYNGLIDAVKVSNTEKYTSDFNPALDFYPDQNTLALWKFNEGSGNVVYDASGNGNHGQIVGAIYNTDTPVLLPPLKEILVRYECNMEIEILGGRFDPSSGYVEIRGSDFGWGHGVRMQKDPTNNNAYYYEDIQSLRAGENVPEYKFWYSWTGVNPIGTWEDGSNRTYQITQSDFNNGRIVINRVFNDLTLDQVTNVPTTILMTIDTKGGHDVWGNPIEVPINTLHITGSSFPLSWSGWYNNTSSDMMQMYDDGTHGDIIASDGIYSNALTFHAYSPLQIQYAYVINFVQSGFIPYENPYGDNHIFNLEQNLVSAKVSNVYGFMSSVTGVTPLTDKVYTIQHEITQALTELTNLLGSSTGETQEKVSEALDALTNIQNKKYWIDDSHLSDQGQKVFEDSKKSIEELMEIKTGITFTTLSNKSTNSNILGIIDHIYNADFNIVNTLLKEVTDKYNQKGCGNNPTNKNCKKIKKDIDNVIDELFHAKEKYSKGDFDKAVEELKKGWQNLRELFKEKLFKGSNSETIEKTPTEFALMQNYPNPFNPVTTISYSIPQLTDVTLKVYDLLGREVVELVNGEKNPGRYEVNFDGTKLSSGVYFYRLTAGSFTQIKKLLLIK